MARDAGLRLAQDGGEIGDGQLRLGQQREDAQPRGLAGGLERAIERLEWQVGSGGHAWASLSVRSPRDFGEDIKISLYALSRDCKTASGQPDGRQAVIAGSGRGMTSAGAHPRREPMQRNGPDNDDRHAFGIRDGEVAIDLPGSLRRLALFHRPHPHALDPARGLPQERARIRRRLHPRGRPALGAGAHRRRELHATWWCFIGWTGRGAIWCCRCRATTAIARGTFALRSPARPNPIAMSVVRLVGVDGNEALGDRPRLPRRHAAPRHQALFRLDRRRCRRGGRLARRPQGLTPAGSAARRYQAPSGRFTRLRGPPPCAAGSPSLTETRRISAVWRTDRPRSPSREINFPHLLNQPVPPFDQSTVRDQGDAMKKLPA